MYDVLLLPNHLSFHAQNYLFYFTYFLFIRLAFEFLPNTNAWKEGDT